MRYGDREPRGGIGVDAAALDAALHLLGESLPSVAAGTSAGALLDALPLDPGAREAIRARLEVSSAASADRRRGDGARRPRGALGRHLPEHRRRQPAPAARPRGRARVGRPPREPRRADRVGRRTPSSSRAAVPSWRSIASSSPLPATVIGRIAFDPPLPEPLRAAYAAVEYGHAAKLFVPLVEDAAPSAVLSVPERYWTLDGDGGGRRPAGRQCVRGLGSGSRPASRRGGRRARGSTRSHACDRISLLPRTRRCSRRGTTTPGRSAAYSSAAPAAGRVVARGAVPRLRRAHPRHEPGADGRSARKRHPRGARDPRAQLRSRPPILTVRSNALEVSP